MKRQEIIAHAIKSALSSDDSRASNKSTMNRITQLLTIALLLAPTLAASSAQAEHKREQLLGQWRCQGAITRPEANYRVESVSVMHADGRLSNSGIVYASNQLLAIEFPMKFQATGTWALVEQQLTGEITDGSIQSGSTLLDQLAQSLKNQVTQTPFFTTPITELNQQTLVLTPTGHPAIKCKR